MSREKTVLSLSQGLGDVPPHDALGQALRDGGLAHPRLADEHRVVLGLAAEHPDHPADLLIPTDHRIELAVPGRLHQVPAVALQRLVGPLRRGAGDPLVAADLLEGVEQPGLVHPEGLEHLRQGAAGGLEDRQGQVLHRDVFVLHPGGEPFRRHQRLGQVLLDVDLALLHAGAGDRRSLGDDLVQSLGEGVRRDVHPGQQPGEQPAVLLGQGEEEMVRPHRLVVGFDGQLLGVGEGFLGLLGELVGIHGVGARGRVGGPNASTMPSQ